MLWEERASLQSTTLDGVGKPRQSRSGANQTPVLTLATAPASLDSAAQASVWGRLRATYKNQGLDVKGVHLAPTFR
jgi:hypothetical protein